MHQASTAPAMPRWGECTAHRQCESIRPVGGGGVPYTVLACEPLSALGTTLVRVVVFGPLTESFGRIFELIRAYAKETLIGLYDLDNDGRTTITISLSGVHFEHAIAIYCRLQDAFAPV